MMIWFKDRIAGNYERKEESHKLYLNDAVGDQQTL